MFSVTYLFLAISASLARHFGRVWYIYKNERISHGIEVEGRPKSDGPWKYDPYPGFVFF